MLVHQNFTQLNSIWSLDKGIDVVSLLGFNVGTNINSLILLLDLESQVVVIAYTILIAPEHSKERSVRPFFSLSLPNLIINVLHDFVGYSTLNARIRHSLPELGDQDSFTLATVVDCCLFKAVNNPLEIRRRNVDFFLLEFTDFCLGGFIIFDFEWPVFFDCILKFRVYWLSKFDVVWRHFLATIIKLAVL